jgi:uncharacterized protein YjbI with pentapeptide repeats
MEAFAAKRDRRAGVKRLDDTALLPEGNPPPQPKQRIVAPVEGLTQRQMERRAEHQVAEMRKMLVEYDLDTSALDKVQTHVDTSVDPDEMGGFDGPPPTEEDIKKQLAERTEAEIAKMRAELAGIEGEAGERARADLENAAEAVRRGPIGPPSFSRAGARREVEQQVALLVSQGQDARVLQDQLDDPKLDRQLRELEASVRETYRTTVQHQGVAPAQGPEARDATRARVLEMVKKGESFAFVDLTGADLSGLDLRGARLSRAFMESVDLTGADLAGAELDFAVLARARLAGADLSKCDKLQGANLSGAALAGVDFSGKDLTGCYFVGADLSATRFVDARLDDVDFGKATMRATDLSGSTAKRLLFHKMRLEGISIRGARWERPLFAESEIVGLDARGADIKSLAFVDTIVDGGVFDDATLLKMRAARAMGETVLRRCSFVGTVAHKAFLRTLDLRDSDFRHSDFKEGDFSEATLDGSDFQDARLRGARFMAASIRRCRFDRADLMEALLGGAVMDQASFESANLFRADFARTGGEGVNMRGANVKWVRTAPKREELP